MGGRARAGRAERERARAQHRPGEGNKFGRCAATVGRPGWLAAPSGAATRLAAIGALAATFAAAAPLAPSTGIIIRRRRRETAADGNQRAAAWLVQLERAGRTRAAAAAAAARARRAERNSSRLRVIRLASGPASQPAGGAKPTGRPGGNFQRLAGAFLALSCLFSITSKRDWRDSAGASGSQPASRRHKRLALRRAQNSMPEPRGRVLSIFWPARPGELAFCGRLAGWLAGRSLLPCARLGGPGKRQAAAAAPISRPMAAR